MRFVSQLLAAALVTALAFGAPVAAEEVKPPAGSARLNCSVATDGVLSNCVLASETPRGQGWGAKALELAKTTKVEARATAADNVIVPFNFAAEATALAVQPLLPRTDEVAAGQTPSGAIYSLADSMQRPTSAQINSVYPSMTRGPGTARMRCNVNERGELKECKILSEAPSGQGFGKAALRIAPYMRLRPKLENGRAIPGTVIIPVNFAPPSNSEDSPASSVGELPGPPSSRPTVRVAVYTMNDILKQPTAAEISRASPVRGFAQAGSAVISCQVNTAGDLTDCTVYSESRPDAGLGSAALRLQSLFKIRVRMESGEAITGSIRIPIRFGQ